MTGVVPLTFTTYYNSARPLPGDNPIYSNLPLGNRWNHSYNTALAIGSAGGFVYVMWGRGGVEGYAIPQAAGGPYANAGARLGSSLVKTGDGSYTLTYLGQQVYRFSANGRLSAIVDRNGNQATLAYNAQGQLQTVSDVQSGHSLTLTYDGSWLKSVGDGTRSVSYAVTGGNLVSMTNPRNKTRTFAYAASGTSLLQTIVDFSGPTVVKNTYQNDRIQFQQDARALAGGQSYGNRFQWSTGSYETVETSVAEVTDRLDNASHYESLAGNGARCWNATSSMP